MQLGLFSADPETLSWWTQQLPQAPCTVFEDEATFLNHLREAPDTIFLIDRDSVAAPLERLIREERFSGRVAVLERCPCVSAGMEFLERGVLAYGNSRMLRMHLHQLVNALDDGNVWIYPELMGAVVARAGTRNLSIDAGVLSLLTEKEQEVTLLILEGLTDGAIGRRLEISARTVRSHLESIFRKLRVDDRPGVVLLLK